VEPPGTLSGQSRMVHIMPDANHASTYEGFSLSHAAILDGTTGAEATEGDIYGVDDAGLDPNIGNFDNNGDDTTLSTWNWLNFATVNVRGGYVPFRLIALLTGESVASSGTGANNIESILLWTDRSMNIPPKPMLIRMPAKDADGNIATLEFVLFKVQFQPITFDGPKYKEGLKISYQGRALMSGVNEAGVSLDTAYGVPAGTKAVGRLVRRLT
jgi:hypothetical protein